MRNLCLLLGAGLLISGFGCCRTLQHTAGVCDCNPPPVGSLLVGPTGAHSSLGVYADIPYPPSGAVGKAPTAPGTLPKVEPIPVAPR